MTDFSCGYDLTCHLAAGRLFTEETGAVILGEVANADNLFAAALETGLDAVQKVGLTVFEVSAKSEGAEVGQLNYAGK